MNNIKEELHSICSKTVEEKIKSVQNRLASLNEAMENENQFNSEEIYSKKVRAGKRRTYFFDVRTTRSNDYYITITESKRRFEGDGYERHKLHLYKEDFNKFLKAFEETVNHVKGELMPDYDYDEFSRDNEGEYNPELSSNTNSGDSEESSDSKEFVDSANTEESNSEEESNNESNDDSDDDSTDESWSD